MGLWWVLGAAAIAAVLWAALASTRGQTNGRIDSPERIAKKRYAQGEIDRDAFQRIMHDLKG
jgi:uncharacterized membrane protein